MFSELLRYFDERVGRIMNRQSASDAKILAAIKEAELATSQEFAAQAVVIYQNHTQML